MIDNKNNYLKIFLVIITLTINIKPCFAFSISSSGDSSLNNSMFEGSGEYQEGNRKIKYTYKYSVSANKSVNINAYNMDGESVIPYDANIDLNKYKFKAGTWIGINVTETQSSSWKIDVTSFKFSEVKKTYLCLYEKIVAKTCYMGQPGLTLSQCYNGGCIDTVCKNADKNNCTCRCPIQSAYVCGTKLETKKKFFTASYYGDFTCPALEGYTTKNEKGTSQEVTEELPGYNNANVIDTEVTKLKAAARGLLGSSTGKIRYIKVNDYPLDLNVCLKNPNKCYKTITGTSKDGIQAGPTDGKTYGSYYINFEYLQEKTCINAKSSDITYGRECNDNELKIENAEIYDEHLGKKVRYWHYFIPLNAKSSDEFWIEAITNENNNFNVNECISIITSLEKTNQKYQYYISPLKSENSFVGDYLEYENKQKSKDYKLLEEGGGCSLSTKIKIPISQEFYNEDNEYKFKGFNFYYRPIDISDPFPNGIDNTSIWYDWSQSSDKNPDLTESYSTRTYIAQISNVNEVRNYTKNNPYTSWDNMYLNGISKFIEDTEIVTRIVARDSFYRLGCGPANEDWEECKR